MLQPVYVAKDTIEAIVTLRNPFGIDLEIQNLSLRSVRQGRSKTDPYLLSTAHMTSSTPVNLSHSSYHPHRYTVSASKVSLVNRVSSSSRAATCASEMGQNIQSRCQITVSTSRPERSGTEDEGPRGRESYSAWTIDRVKSREVWILAT